MLVVPKTTNLAVAFDQDLAAIAASERALRNGILVLAPRETKPHALTVACQMWPYVLRPLFVTRVAVVLGVQTYASVEPVLASCIRGMKKYRIKMACFHEGHLESDAIQAWFEKRKPQRRITSEVMIELSGRYEERGDRRGAYHAIELAEKLAG